MIIGDPKTFGIESEITDTNSHILGTVRLWIAGLYIGSDEDVNLLGVTECSLEHLMKRPDAQDWMRYANLPAKELFKKYRKDDALEATMLALGESFDDFTLFAILGKEEIRFVWQLHKKPFFQYPNYPKGVCEGFVKRDVVFARIREYCDFLDRASPTSKPKA